MQVESFSMQKSTKYSAYTMTRNMLKPVLREAFTPPPPPLAYF